MNFHQTDRLPAQLRENGKYDEIVWPKRVAAPLAAIDFAFALEALVLPLITNLPLPFELTCFCTRVGGLQNNGTSDKWASFVQITNTTRKLCCYFRCTCFPAENSRQPGNLIPWQVHEQ